MARPRVEFPPATDLRAMADGQGRLAVRVTPGARAEGITIEHGRVLVKVRARPEDGKATAAVLNLVATALGVAASKVAMLRGATSREKLLQIPPEASAQNP